ncbi:MAG: hypothetical protein K6V36_11220, partial [Anaerolineae bacterium]|nr:hypothetical protein [Anaerolineae bacterium]
MKALVLTADWDPRPGYVPSDWEETTRKAITGSSVWRHPRLEVKEAPQPARTKAEAVFYLAAAARRLNHKNEAIQNYQLYLSALPDG